MTAVGKMLVVVNLVLGIVVMVFAGAVYQVQVNWKTLADKNAAAQKATANKINELTSALAESTSKHDLLKSKYDNDMEAEKNRRIADVRDAKFSKDLYDQKVTEAQRHNANHDLAKQDKVALSEQNNEMRKTLDELRDKNKTLNEDLAKEKDAKFQVTRERDVARTAHTKLLTENHLLTKFIVKKGFGMDEVRKVENEDFVPPPPAGLKAKVLGTQLVGGPGGSLNVEISVGSDDGIAKDHRLAITNAQRGFQGYIQITTVTSDRAAGLVVSAQPNANIQRGDDVTVPKFKLIKK